MRTVALHLALLGMVTGCAPKRPPATIYPTPIPELPAPPEPDVPERFDEDCPSAQSLVPGRPAPFVDESGAGTCTAVVLPSAQALQLQFNARTAAPFWRESAESCWAYRGLDRTFCDARFRQVEEERDDAIRAARRNRLAAIFGTVGGVIVGAVITGSIAVGLDRALD